MGEQSLTPRFRFQKRKVGNDSLLRRHRLARSRNAFTETRVEYIQPAAGVLGEGEEGMSNVDLSLANQGRIKFESGTEFWCPSLGRIGEDEFSVRIESGWYKTYKRNGESICAGEIHDKHGNFVRYVKGQSIVEFEPMGYERAEALGLDGQTTP